MSVVISGTDGITSPAINAGNIVGQICFFGMITPPDGFLKANGAAISRTAYAGLFAAIGTTFGVGDGSTTFNVPDLRGEFPRGWDDGKGVDTGRVFGSEQDDAFRSHLHLMKIQRITISNGTGNTVQLATDFFAGNVNTYNTGGTETRPFNVALLACIKY